MSSLRILQKRFARALLDRSAAPPEDLAPAQRTPGRFGVYRNNVFAGLQLALANRFPVCRALVGEEFFAAMAGLFVELAPPRSPVLMTYGEDFPGFVELFPPARPVPYLADVARLEAARTRAYHAADAAPCAADDLARCAPDAWEEARVTLHPSAEIVTSAWPIVSIWEAHGQPNPPWVEAIEPEDALVARPDLEVEVRRLAPGCAIFLSQLMAGAALREAAEAAARRQVRFDLVRALAGLIGSRIIVALHGPQAGSQLFDPAGAARG